MAIAQPIKRLLDYATELTPKLAFANSDPMPLEDGAHRFNAKLEIGKQLESLPAIAAAAAETCPSIAAEVVALRNAIGAAFHSAGHVRCLCDARDALEAAAYAELSDEYIGPHSPTEWRKRFGRMSESTWRREVKHMRVDRISAKSIRIHRDDVARYEKKPSPTSH